MTRQDFLRALQESKLLTLSEVERIDADYPDIDAAELARALTTAGTLTAYQAEAIRQGKGVGLLIGNYEVLDRLGAGGMGTVFKARHRRMKRVVALKVLSRELSSDATFVQRFQREVETIARLSHPNIVMAYDADVADVGHFLVMEFVNGQDLVNLVQKQGQGMLDVKTAVDCILQAARGLDYAHRQGIIHRDIKPANLLRDVTGVVKVTDLGLARFNPSATAGGETAETSLTKVGGIMGTADYMPPEQAIDATSIDQRADIYSLGATLYYLLFGRGPYSAPNLMATLLKHREAPIPSLREARQDVPAALDDIFRRMLAKQAADRPTTMAEVVAGLEPVLAALSGPVMAPAAAQPTAPAPDTTVTDPESGRIISVLLVEPSRTQAGIIRRYLQSMSVAQIAVAASGQNALQSARESCPDGIVCTMHLNDMTGVQLAQHIRAAGLPRTPGFVLISTEDDAGAEAASQSGQVVLLHKPFTATALVNALKRSSPTLRALKAPTENTPTVVTRPPSSATPPATDRSKQRVLIVDDSAAARAHERNILKGLGFAQFVEAIDGAQAVAAVSREKFDLIVTDYNMPYMDGAGLVGYLKQNASTVSVPIVMVTTETDPQKLEAVRQLGVTICNKNFPVELVQKVIDQIF
jgi:serine/threonine protein kinase